MIRELRIILVLALVRVAIRVLPDNCLAALAFLGSTADALT